MTDRPALQRDVVLSRADAWHTKPHDRLAQLRQDVLDLEAGARRAHSAYGSADGPAARSLARALVEGMERDLLERRRYVVTFRRHHRI